MPNKIALFCLAAEKSASGFLPLSPPQDRAEWQPFHYPLGHKNYTPRKEKKTFKK
jgi:hypothetical protein